MADNIIKLKPSRIWQANSFHIRFVERVAKIIYGNDTVNVKEGGYKWMLGTGNDWWMDIDRETGDYILAHRYFMSGIKDSIFKAIILFMGLEELDRGGEATIRIKTGGLWLNHLDIEFVKRVAMAINGHDFVDDINYDHKWRLGHDEHWWMDKDLKTNEFIIGHKYGMGGNPNDIRKALIYLIHLSHFNIGWKED